MTRPPVSVVMPFAGSAADARRAVSTLLALERREGDELILADNSAIVPATPGLLVVPALAERSPAHARNAGAERARHDWILFLDSDCRPGPGLLDAYFACGVAPELGALAGGITAEPDGATAVARYGSARNFLHPEAHLAHPYRPRAVAANLLVRRRAFEQVGGFYEGVRAAEDTDFSWRLQEAGWRLELRPQAAVEHRYRASLAELRHQWRGYAAGRAWLARRYPDFTPEPALVRAVRRLLGRRPAVPGPRALAGAGPRAGGPSALVPAGPRPAGPRAPAGYLALDAVLALEEIAGFALSNRPARDAAPPSPLVLLAERFPARGDPLVDEARRLDQVRIEAAGRPDAIDKSGARALRIDYREDDGIAARALALAALALRHPVRSLEDVLARGAGEPGLAALAPAARRLARDSAAHGTPCVRPLGRGDAGNGAAAGGGETEAVARRLAALAGARFEPGRT